MTEKLLDISIPNNEFLSDNSDMELNEDMQKAMEVFDDSENLFDTDTLNVVGVFAGIKPAMITSPMSGDVLQQYRQSSQDLGLIVEEMQLREDEGPTLIIARSKEAVDTLSTGIPEVLANGKTMASPEIEGSVGRALGFPESAVKYYVERLEDYVETGELSDFVDLPAEYEDARPFVEFVLSPDNYEEEIAEYVEPLRQAVLKYTPKLYNRIVELEKSRDD